MNINTRLHCFLAILSIWFTSVAQVDAAPRPFDELIVFGDSGSDNGNLNIVTHELVVPPPYWGGRFSNGPLWVERLAERLRLGHPTEMNALPAPSEAGGTNYAYGGADAGGGFSDACAEIDGALTCAPNVGLQIENFFEDGRTLNGDELIVVQAGANNAFQAQIAARAMGDHIRTLATAGGKFFLVPNLDQTLSLAPLTSPDPAYDQFIAAFNAELEEQLVAVEGAFDITIIRQDVVGLGEAMIHDPARFGLVNITDPACPGCGFGIPEPGAEDTIVPNPEEHLFWDYIHWTAVPNRLWGDLAADQVEAALRASRATTAAVPEPATLAMCLVSMFAICIRRVYRRGN